MERRFGSRRTLSKYADFRLLPVSKEGCTWVAGSESRLGSSDGGCTAAEYCNGLGGYWRMTGTAAADVSIALLSVCDKKLDTGVATTSALLSAASLSLLGGGLVLILMTLWKNSEDLRSNCFERGARSSICLCPFECNVEGGGEFRNDKGGDEGAPSCGFCFSDTWSLAVVVGCILVSIPLLALLLLLLLLC